MPQSLTTTEGVLIIPGGYSTYTVKTDVSGLSTTGVLMLVGEAASGPHHTQETDLELNSFGPNSGAAVAAKYGSGPLVDAFRAAAVPSADLNIIGAPNRIVLVKTNLGTKARIAIEDTAAATYGYIADRSYGKLGNLIYTSITADTSEVIPTTGAFTFIPPVSGFNYAMRANGAAVVGSTITANATPTSFVSTVAALAGVIATGGATRGAHPASGTLAIATPVGNAIVVTTSSAWGATPVIGDTLVIPVTSILASASGASASGGNVGGYVITGVTATTISATKLADGGKSSPTVGTITAPVAVSATSVVGAADMVVYGPVTIALEAGVVLDGVGKSLEIAQLAASGGSLLDLFERTAFQLGTTTAVTWLSKTSAPKLLTSASEYIATLNIARQSDQLSQALTMGGEIALKIGYTGTSASLVISDMAFTTTVVGGAGASLALDLADYATLNDLATYITNQAGYTCAVGSGILGQLSPTTLDDVTTSISTSWGSQTGRLKIDAFRFFQAISDQSALVQLENAAGTVIQATKGLPAVKTTTFLAGGLKGSTSDANFTAAVDALRLVTGNFLVPLFSRDADDDVADNLTDSGSAYTIAAIHAACKTHVLAMSTLKQKRNRQAFLSIEDTFAVAKTTASDIANFRCIMAFQDVKRQGSTGSIVQFQPWMAATNAAAMQAAGGYKSIVKKKPNVSSALQLAADFDDRNIDDVEDALKAGLLPLRRGTNGLEWVSDQTTYGKDSNFVFNSIQAVYSADTISLTVSQKMEDAFAGQSLADVSAPIALRVFDEVMENLLKLKLTAVSDDAVKGYKDAQFTLVGPSMQGSAEVKLAGTLYFVKINFLISQVQQSA